MGDLNETEVIHLSSVLEGRSGQGKKQGTPVVSLNLVKNHNTNSANQVVEQEQAINQLHAFDNLQINVTQFDSNLQNYILSESSIDNYESHS